MKRYLKGYILVFAIVGSLIYLIRQSNLSKDKVNNLEYSTDSIVSIATDSIVKQVRDSAIKKLDDRFKFYDMLFILKYNSVVNDKDSVIGKLQVKSIDSIIEKYYESKDETPLFKHLKSD